MRLAVLAVLLILSVAPADARQAVLTPGQYRESLAGTAAALERGDLAGARQWAVWLLPSRVEYESAALGTDAALLERVRKVATAGEAAALAHRLRALVRALEAAATPAGGEVDAALLARLRAEERPFEVPEGGDLPTIAPPPSAPAWLIERLAAALRWLGDRFEEFLRWLMELWPSRGQAEEGGGIAGAVSVVVAVMVLGLGLLAVRALRRRGEAPVPVVESEALGAVDRDEDPLSRESNEWEKHAQALAAAGRFREAVRAYYHAVLSTLFVRGLLRPERGRTNWEYAARLPPEAAWRRSFLDLTRRFDHEWYGRDRSTGEALAACADLARRILRALRAQEAP